MVWGWGGLVLMHTPYSNLILLHVTGDSYLLEVSSSLSDVSKLSSQRYALEARFPHQSGPTLPSVAMAKWAGHRQASVEPNPILAWPEPSTWCYGPVTQSLVPFDSWP